LRIRFQPGEKVKFLHSSDIGVVLQAYPNDRLLVLVDDILEMEVGVNEVVKFEHKPSLQATSINPEFLGLEKGIYLAIELGPRLRYHLINNTPYLLSFNFFINTEGECYQGKVSATVEPQAMQLLMIFLKENWVENSRLLFHFLFFQENNEKLPPPPEQLHIQIKDKYFQKTPIRLPNLAHDCLIIAILVEKKPSNIPLPIPEVEKAIVKPEIVLDYDVPQSVVDLHINKLVTSTKGLSKAAILAIQIEAFEKALSQSFAHGMREITFIHGVGNGVLKDEIHKILSKNPFVREFGIEKTNEYGQGATVVRFY
jgi:hypothetical protein